MKPALPSVWTTSYSWWGIPRPSPSQWWSSPTTHLSLLRSLRTYFQNKVRITSHILKVHFFENFFLFYFANLSQFVWMNLIYEPLRLRYSEVHLAVSGVCGASWENVYLSLYMCVSQITGHIVPVLSHFVAYYTHLESFSMWLCWVQYVCICMCVYCAFNVVWF